VWGFVGRGRIKSYPVLYLNAYFTRKIIMKKLLLITLMGWMLVSISENASAQGTQQYEYASLTVPLVESYECLFVSAAGIEPIKFIEYKGENIGKNPKIFLNRFQTLIEILNNKSKEGWEPTSLSGDGGILVLFRKPINK
jgi:hypothetical protein